MSAKLGPPNKPMKPTVAFGARSLSARCYADLRPGGRMRTRTGLQVLSAAGLFLYATAAFMPLLLHPQFWTSQTMAQDRPWYFMGQALIAGACAAVAFALTLVLGAVAKRKYGHAVWGSLTPAFLFLSMPIGQGLAVLLSSQRMWEGPQSASSVWHTSNDYLVGSSVAGFLALGIAAAVVFRFGHAWRAQAAEQPDGPDEVRVG